MTDEKISATLELHPETIELLQKTPLLKCRFGRSFEQTLESYLEMVASTVEHQLAQLTAEERRAEMHLVHGAPLKKDTEPKLVLTKAMMKKKYPDMGVPSTHITLKRKHQRWLLKQMDLQRRNFPTRINRFGKPKNGDRMSLPWLCDQILNEVLEKWTRSARDKDA